jgi:hypothetical protein
VTTLIPEAHCSVEFHPDWPLTTNQGALSQPVGDSGGTVFLHYGPSSTLEQYVGGWQARYGDGAVVTTDTATVTADGVEGRRLGLALGEEAVHRMGAGHAVTPAQTLVCTGYTIASMPVLLGYLVPQATDRALIEAAEAIVASLRVT